MCTSLRIENMPPAAKPFFRIIGNALPQFEHLSSCRVLVVQEFRCSVVEVEG